MIEFTLDNFILVYSIGGFIAEVIIFTTMYRMWDKLNLEDKSIVELALLPILMIVLWLPLLIIVVMYLIIGAFSGLITRLKE